MFVAVRELRRAWRRFGLVGLVVVLVAVLSTVVVGLSDMGDRFRLTLNEVDVVEPDEDLPRLPVACAVWKPRPSLSTSAEAWLMAGAPHHTVLSTALDTEVITDFAEATGTELAVIDADTTPRAFQRELRWTAAYHRLVGNP